jgi:hypothetical protein
VVIPHVANDEGGFPGIPGCFLFYGGKALRAGRLHAAAESQLERFVVAESVPRKEEKHHDEKRRGNQEWKAVHEFGLVKQPV